MSREHKRDTAATVSVLIPVIAILLLAFAVRVHLLDAQSLWHDEGNSVVQAARTLPQIADNAARDIHPPGYYWLLHGWRLLVGESEFALRMLSTLASTAAIAFAYTLGRRLYGPLAAGTAAAFIALNTFSIYYAQEARMYALLALWSAAAIWALVGMVQARDRRVWRYALLLGIFNAAGMYTQYAYAFVLLAQGLLLLAYVAGMKTAAPLRSLFAFTAANLFALALFAPWLPTAWEQVTTWPSTGEPVGLSLAVAEILARLGFGITVGTGTTISVAFFALFGLLVLPGSPPGSRWRMLVPLVWVVASVGAFLALGLFREANLKFLLPAQIGFALLIGRGVWVLWTLEIRRETRWQKAAPKAAALVGTFALLLTLWRGLDPLYHDPAYQRDDYRAIARLIEREAGSEDAVILSAPNQQEVFDYYYTGETPVYGLPPGLGADDATTRAAVQDVIASAARVYAVFWATGERDPEGIVESTLNRDAFAAGSAWYGTVRLAQFITPDDLTYRLQPDAQFGESIILREIATNSDEVASVDTASPNALQIRLTWQTNAPLSTRYKIFVQLLAPDGSLAAQTDAEPGGLVPTTTWAAGEAVNGNHALIVPPDLPAGTYALIVGLYDIDDPSARLPVTLPPGSGLTTGDGYLLVDEIRVQAGR